MPQHHKHSSLGAVLEAVRLVLGLHVLPGGVLEPITMQGKSWEVSQKDPGYLLFRVLEP